MTLAAEQRTLRLIKQSTHTCPAACRFDFRIIAATKPQFNLGLGRRWGHALPNEKAAESGQRNGAAHAGLQHEAGDPDSGRWRIDGRHAGLRCWARPNQLVHTSQDVVKARGARFSNFRSADSPNPRPRHRARNQVSNRVRSHTAWTQSGH